MTVAVHRTSFVKSWTAQRLTPSWENCESPWEWQCPGAFVSAAKPSPLLEPLLGHHCWNRRPQDPAKLLKKQADPQLSCLGLETGKMERQLFQQNLVTLVALGESLVSIVLLYSSQSSESQCLPEGRKLMVLLTS